MSNSLSTSGQRHRLGAQDVVAVEQVRHIREVQGVVVPSEEAVAQLQVSLKV